MKRLHTRAFAKDTRGTGSAGPLREPPRGVATAGSLGARF